jgi:hypothetical protein
VKQLIKQKIYLEELDLVHLDKTWRELDLLLNKQELYTSVTTDYQTVITELLNFMKFYLDIFHCGEKFKILTYYHTKDMPSLNINIDVWLNLQSRQCQINLWIVIKLLLFVGQIKIQTQELHKFRKKMKEECFWEL